MTDLQIVVLYAKQTGAEISTLTHAHVVALCDHCLAKNDSPTAPITVDIVAVHAAANAIKGEL